MSDGPNGIEITADESSEFELLRSRGRDLGHGCLRLRHRTTAIERLLIEKELLTIEEIERREAQVADEELRAVTAAVRAGKKYRIARLLESFRGSVQ